MRRIACAFLLSMAAAPALAQAPTQTLTIGLAEDADLLDPALGRTYVGRIVFAGLCDKLFDLDEKLNIVPMLATGYEYTDPKTLVLHLRDGVKFHDGTTMDAAAVKATLDRNLTLPESGRRGEIGAMDHAEIIDKLTLRIVLKAPSAPFLSQLTDRAGMIVSPKAVAELGKNFATHPVCAGPFKFTERVAQDHITLDRFPEYWNAGAIHLARVIYRPIVDNSVKLANLQSGAVQLAERMAPTDADTVRKDKSLALMVYPWLGYNSINFNVGHGPRADTPLGRDARVRRAFELSIDRQALVQVVYNGMMTPLAQAVTSASPFYDQAVQPGARDVAKARALLAEAGVKGPVKVTLVTSNSPDQQQLGEVIQSMAQEAGFEVTVQPTEFVASLDAADRGDFQAYVIGWSGRVDPDGNEWNELHSGAPLNYPHYASKDVDGWLDAARETTDQAQRKALYAKIAEQTARDLPIMYLYAPPNIIGASAKLHGFAQVPDGMIRLQGVSLSAGP